ncbi:MULTISPECIES: DUF6452 family protein [unclassified Flavobacterium]|uniref:DUF6452 family protein n=1 Tax=unclassified Flavobacterium TaxID=196869 RepID=UPI00086E7358|nr:MULTISPECIES: DUF6452 family protein [unclassified Flavobacterium]MBN9283009.1 hypothetical protein [Flavobacterium sp.]ODS82943.1 MAG: hypothetical protein ABS44_17855 [Chryseobacterium sp. SCN 40-13]OJV67644.1 MAG: hypothetical protein BGO42_16560 [Flavobacterium sp. 40-81]
MKKIKTLLVAFIIANAFWSCEKDDICADGTPTTPSVVIEFYDKNDPTVLKSVTNLRVIADGMTEPIIFNATGNEDTKYLTTANKIKIPLKTTEDITSYHFTQNAANPAISNEDHMVFNYSRTDQYVSRACGYKTTFKLAPNNPVIPEGDTDKWISNIVTVQSNIENPNETHLKIYF